MRSATAAQYAGREHKEGADQLEYSGEGEANNPKRQQDKPNQRGQNENQKGQRPTDNQKYAPEQERYHARYTDL